MILHMEIDEQIREDNQIRKEKSNRLVTEAPTHELVKELIRRDEVWAREVITCEHYAVSLRGHVLEQGIGAATILVVRPRL